MTKSIENADLTHEDARGWYDSYGWHITTENEGDVTIDAVEYDWLDGTDAEAIAKLRETYDGLTDDAAIERQRNRRRLYLDFLRRRHHVQRILETDPQGRNKIA